MAMYQTYSVLMSVYYKEKAEYLEQSMESIFSQTSPTDDFVLVCDGPLNKELDAVIERMQAHYANILHVVRLEKNVGLGNALNEGIKYCKNDLIARMDSDDIAYSDRCERQLMIFSEQNIDVCSGIVDEFWENTNEVTARRVLPETSAEIYEFAKKRNPFNHPCVMFRKSSVEAVGGYQDFYLLEDYYLWIRMLLSGYKGYNIQKSLLWMRAGSGMYKRRAGWKHAKTQVKLFWYMKKQGFISNLQFISSAIIRVVSSIAPNQLREYVFKRVLRS